MFDCIKRGLEAGASSNAGVTLTVIHPHSAFPFARSSDGARSHAGSRSKRPHHSEASGMGLSSSSANAPFDRTDSAAVAIGDIELDQDLSRAAASISRGRVLPSGAVDLTVKVTPLGLGFMPSKILVSSDFDCRCVFSRHPLAQCR